jgi:signal transduction histidine kinase
MIAIHRTIRFRITALAVVLCAVLLIVVAVVMTVVLRQQLTDNLDEGLRQRSDAFGPLLTETPSDALFIDEDLLVQLVDSDGRVMLSSPNLSGASPLADTEPGYRNTTSVPGRAESFRLFVREIDTSTGPAILIVGANLDDVTDPVGILTRLLAGAVPAVIVLLAALVWWLTGRTLRPVEAMRAEMAEISGSNPERRVIEPQTGDEIDRLARTMNGTLERLDNALRRQQQFVADASHELRSPLTRMRGELELELTHPGLTDADETTRSVLAETVALQHLVEDLLHLARSDAGVEIYTEELIDLDDAVLREARRLGERGRVTVDVHQVAAVQVNGDAAHLGRAIRNLLDNAERHAASTVTISLSESTDAIRLIVRDDGDGVPVEQRDAIFERFTRLDDARSSVMGGSGLGLAITREIIERHNGTIQLADPVELDSGAVFVVDLPAGRSGFPRPTG